MTWPKRRYDLIPPESLRHVANAFTHGQKHDTLGEAPGWTTCSDWRDKYTGSLMRHLEEYRLGNFLDESGIPHLAMVAANALILLARELRKK